MFGTQIHNLVVIGSSPTRPTNRNPLCGKGFRVLLVTCQECTCRTLNLDFVGSLRH